MKLTTKLKNISYTGNNFDKWFGDIDFPEIDSMIPLESKKLPRSMNDQEILAELKPEPVLLSEVYKTLDAMDKSTLALFYVKDVSGVLRAVDVGWDVDGWLVDADGVARPDAWSDGNQVFSRNWNLDTLKSVTLSSSDTLSLESAIKTCKENGLIVTKVY